MADISKLNFKHSKLIENSVDFMKEFHSYSYINNKKNQILSETNENLVKSVEDSKIVLSTIGNWFMSLGVRLFLIFILIILIILLFCLFKDKIVKLINFYLVKLINSFRRRNTARIYIVFLKLKKEKKKNSKILNCRKLKLIILRIQLVNLLR